MQNVTVSALSFLSNDLIQSVEQGFPKSRRNWRVANLRWYSNKLMRRRGRTSRPPLYKEPATSVADQGAIMNLHAPSMLVFVISLILAVLAVVGIFVLIPYVTIYAFWIAIGAYVVLALGCLMKI